MQQLKNKYSDIPEIAELEEEVQAIINQNCISSVQMAMLYLLGSREHLDPETNEKISAIMHSVLGDK